MMQIIDFPHTMVLKVIRDRRRWSAITAPDRNECWSTRMADGKQAYAGPIVTRKDAMALGLTRYFTGSACLIGHTDQRSAANRGCVTCLREKMAAKYRKDPIAGRLRTKAWRLENPDKVAADNRKPRHGRPPCRTREQSRAYYAQKPEMHRAKQANRRARVAAVGGSFTENDIIVIKALQKNKCANCKISISAGYHIDHIKPIALGGSNNPRNLQLLCQHCNWSKGALDPLDFARRRGKLL